MANSSSEQERLLEQVKRNLEQNGFPLKRVSLPLEKMYEVADSRGLNFNTILEQLALQGIAHEKIGDRILFSMTKGGVNFDQIDPEMLKKVEEYYHSLSPEQREEILRRAKDLGFA